MSDRTLNDEITRLRARVEELEAEVVGIAAGLEDPGPEGMTAEEAVGHLLALTGQEEDANG